MTVERSPMPAKWTWPLESPLRLHANAVRIAWKPTPETPLPPEPFAKNSPREPIRLVPYGCTKFRVSMFPATKRPWQSAESAKQQ